MGVTTITLTVTQLSGRKTIAIPVGISTSSPCSTALRLSLTEPLLKSCSPRRRRRRSCAGGRDPALRLGACVPWSRRGAPRLVRTARSCRNGVSLPDGSRRAWPESPTGRCYWELGEAYILFASRDAVDSRYSPNCVLFQIYTLQWLLAG